MAEATAMANPLSVPVAIVGTVIYGFASSGPSAAAVPGQVGFVNLAAAVALLAGSLPTIFVIKRLAGKIPDRSHAVAYVGLLVLALLGTILV